MIAKTPDYRDRDARINSDPDIIHCNDGNYRDGSLGTLKVILSTWESSVKHPVPPEEAGGLYSTEIYSHWSSSCAI